MNDLYDLALALYKNQNKKKVEVMLNTLSSVFFLLHYIYVVD